jgi:hypothetical protein
MSVFHLIYLQDLKAYPGPVLCPTPEERRQQTGPIATLGHLNKIFKVYQWYPKIFQAIVSQEIPRDKIT